jgi:hypothetical protein
VLKVILVISVLQEQLVLLVIQEFRGSKDQLVITVPLVLQEKMVLMGRMGQLVRSVLQDNRVVQELQEKMVRQVPLVREVYLV